MSVVDNDRDERRSLRLDPHWTPVMRSAWEARLQRCQTLDEALTFVLEAVCQAVDEDRGDEWLAADVTAIRQAWARTWGLT